LKSFDAVHAESLIFIKYVYIFLISQKVIFGHGQMPLIDDGD